jgi:hypothetical protein
MNTPAAIREMDLAAWEYAEADTHERAARALRLKATKRISAVHLELKTALAAARTHSTNNQKRKTA